MEKTINYCLGIVGSRKIYMAKCGMLTMTDKPIFGIYEAY